MLLCFFFFFFGKKFQEKFLYGYQSHQSNIERMPILPIHSSNQFFFFDRTDSNPTNPQHQPNFFFFFCSFRIQKMQSNPTRTQSIQSIQDGTNFFFFFCSLVLARNFKKFQKNVIEPNRTQPTEPIQCGTKFFLIFFFVCFFGFFCFGKKFQEISKNATQSNGTLPIQPIQCGTIFFLNFFFFFLVLLVLVRTVKNCQELSRNFKIFEKTQRNPTECNQSNVDPIFF